MTDAISNSAMHKYLILHHNCTLIITDGFFKKHDKIVVRFENDTVNRITANQKLLSNRLTIQ